MPLASREMDQIKLKGIVAPILNFQFNVYIFIAFLEPQDLAKRNFR